MYISVCVCEWEHAGTCCAPEKQMMSETAAKSNVALHAAAAESKCSRVESHQLCAVCGRSSLVSLKRLPSAVSGL